MDFNFSEMGAEDDLPPACHLCILKAWDCSAVLYGAGKRWAFPEHETEHEIKVLLWVFLLWLLWAEGFRRLDSLFALGYYAVSSSLPCTATWTVHFRQNSSIWFGRSQIASASHSKSKGCGRKHDARTVVCVSLERCLRRSRPAAGRSPRFLFVCASEQVSI